MMIRIMHLPIGMFSGTVVYCSGGHDCATTVKEKNRLIKNLYISLVVRTSSYIL